MYTLAFDTTAAACSVILLQDGKTLSRWSQAMEFGQAEVLIPQIKNILEAQKLSFSDLGLLAVCTGPGSFTGVRASISAARAFGLACPELQVAGVSAFDAYLPELSCDEIAEKNLVVIETKREDFYYQIFDSGLKRLTPPSAGTREDILAQLKGGRKVTIVGDGTERFLMQPSGLSLYSIKMSEGIDVYNVAACALQQYDNKKVDFPKPVYLRAPDVCVK